MSEQRESVEGQGNGQEPVEPTAKRRRAVARRRWLAELGHDEYRDDHAD